METASLFRNYYEIQRIRCVTAAYCSRTTEPFLLSVWLICTSIVVCVCDSTFNSCDCVWWIRVCVCEWVRECWEYTHFPCGVRQCIDFLEFRLRQTYRNQITEDIILATPKWRYTSPGRHPGILQTLSLWDYFKVCLMNLLNENDSDSKSGWKQTMGHQYQHIRTYLALMSV